jgi:hypothetical protein
MSSPLQDTYIKQVIAPAAIVDNASFTTAEIDTVINGVKYDWCTIIFELGAMDIAMSALKVQQSDTTGSGFADLTGFVGGTDFTLPIATSDNGICVFQIDMKGKKRFLDLVATGGDGAAGTFASAIAILSRGKEAPTTATTKGLLVDVIG